MTAAPAPLFPMHDIARDPTTRWMWGDNFEAVRDEAVRELVRDIHAHLQPAGFTRKGNRWFRSSDRGESEFNIQRGKFGFECYLNAAVRPANNPMFKGSEGTIGSSTRYVRLSQFCPEMPNDIVPDGLSYMRLHGDPAFRNGVMRVFAARMVPWITMLHDPKPVETPKPYGFFKRLWEGGGPIIPLPKPYPWPKDMVSVPVFSDA